MCALVVSADEAGRSWGSRRPGKQTCIEVVFELSHGVACCIRWAVGVYGQRRGRAYCAMQPTTGLGASVQEIGLQGTQLLAQRRREWR